MQILHLFCVQIDDKRPQLIISVKCKISIKKIYCAYILHTDENLAVKHFSLTANFLSVNMKKHISRN